MADNEIKLPYIEGQSLEQATTEYILDAKTLSAFVVDGNTNSVSSQIDLQFARDVIGQGMDEIKKGDLSKLEEMLYYQAGALNMMSSNLSRRVFVNTNIYIMAVLANLALKSQNQSRNTIQTLINLKQPDQTAFIKQQTNVANGHQQINNGVAQSSLEKFANVTNELLEEKHGEWLDTGTNAEAERVNKGLEAVV